MGSFGRRVGFAALVGLTVVPCARAQAPGWHVTAEVGASRILGGARGEADGDEITIRPYRPTTYGVRVERIGQRVGLGLALRYASPAFAFEGPASSIVDEELGFTFVELAADVSTRVAGSGGGPSVRLRGGPVLNVWDWSLGDTYTRLGARAGVGVDLPVGRRFGAVISGAATLTGSVFDEEELGPDFDPSSMLRTEIGLGLRYAL